MEDIGTGRIAGRFMSEARSVSGVETQSVYNPHPVSTLKFAEKWDLNGYRTLEDFFPSIDMVYIASPHETHYEYARAAIMAGKHVLCEKPMVLNKDQAVELFAIAMVLRLDGYIWLLPAYGNMAMRLNMAEKRLEQVDLHLPFRWEDRKSNYFMHQSPVLSVGGPWIPGYRPWAEDLPERAIQMTSDRKLYWYNFRTMTYLVEDWSLSEEQVTGWSTPVGESFERCGIDVPYATGEKRETRSVSQYIDYLLAGHHDRDKQRQAWSELANNVDGTCGEKVKEEVLRRLG